MNQIEVGGGEKAKMDLPPDTTKNSPSEQKEHTLKRSEKRERECVCEREKERQKERQRDRERKRERESEREKRGRATAKPTHRSGHKHCTGIIPLH